MPPPADSAPRGATRGVPIALIAIAVLLLVARIAVGLVERGRFERSAGASAPAVRGSFHMGSGSVQGKVQWQTIEAGEALAQQTGKPILYDFTAEWCGPCKRLENEVFARDGVATMISTNFVPIRVTDRQREDGRNPPDVARLQARYQVRAFPTLVVVRGDDLKTRIEGYPGPQQVLSQLMQAGLPD